ncbi:MAG: hypothetical protein QM831_38065 [Kofleriaceae bacterium]
MVKPHATLTASARLALVAILGCGGAPPEPLHTPTQRAQPAPRFVTELSAPMPHVDEVPEFDPQPAGRWPLTLNEHPELEPHFPIANALAQSGISWLDLCNRGAQSRHMAQNAYLGEYLAAWCSVAKDDYRDAIDRLAPLRAEYKLHDAIELDISAILVADSSGTSSSEANRINLINAHIADLTSASYFEIGRLDAALAMSGYASQMDRSNSEDTYCKRLAHEYAISGVGNRGQIQLHLMHPEAFDEQVRCLDLRSQLEPRETRDKIVAAWPKSLASFNQWLDVIVKADQFSDLNLRYRFSVAALEMALRTSVCSHTDLGFVTAYAHKLHDVSNPNFHQHQATVGVDTKSPTIPMPADIEADFVPRLDDLAKAADTASHEPLEDCAKDLRARAEAGTPW